MLRSFLIVLVLAFASAPLSPAAATSCSSGPANDCIANAIEWLANPAWYSNVGATMEAGEPATCDGATVHNSVWLKLEVLHPGTGDQFKVNFDAPWLATLGLYDRATDGTLTQIACSKSWIDPEDHDLYQPVLYPSCTPGKTYWIQVGGQSASAAGAFSVFESRFWHFNMSLSHPCPFKASPPGEPHLSPPEGGAGSISLSWSAPYWTGGRGVAVSSYNVYAAGNCAGPFSLLASTPWRGFTESGLPPATSRCYRVTAVNSAGESSSQPGKSGTSLALPRPPRNLVVSPAADGELRLAWLPSLDQSGPVGMTAHRLYRAVDPQGPFELFAMADGAATSYTDAGLGRGATMHYRVTALNIVGESVPSGAAGATTWDTPGAPRDVVVRHRVGLSPFEFEVAWKAPVDSPAFTHYRVFRASSSEGVAQFIGEVSSASTSFVDRNRGAFVDYHYEVRANNPAGESAPSARACIVYPFDSPFGRC